MKHFTREHDLGRFLQDSPLHLGLSGQILEICRFQYQSPELRNLACRALTTYVTTYRSAVPAWEIPEIAAFLEASDYIPARQALLAHLHALESYVERRRAEFPGEQLSDDGRAGLKALASAVRHLALKEASALSTDPCKAEHGLTVDDTEAVELKPNVFGIGVNLNYILNRLIRLLGRKKSPTTP